MIAVAGGKIFSGTSQALKGLWVAQLVFNGLWSWLFFGQHQAGWALLDIAAMLVCLMAIQMYSRKEAPAIFWLMMPYLVWVSYALTLNAAIFILN